MKQQILLINLFLSFLITGLLVTGGLSYAQDVQVQLEGQVQVQEDHDTKNLDKLLKDYGKDQEQVLKDAEKMLPVDEASELPESDLGDEAVLDPNDAKPFGTKKRTGVFDPNFLKKKGADGNLQKVKYSEAVKVALAPLQKMSEGDLIKLLVENTKGSGAADYIDRYPKIAVFTVRLIKDKEAVPFLAKIADDQDKFIRFAGIMISTILLAFLLKKFMKKEGRPVMKAVSLWFFRFVIITGLRIAIILFFFGSEIAPTFRILSKTFL